MKKKLLLLVVVLLALGCCMLASCDLGGMLGPGASGGTTATGYKFENVNAVYDGTPKTIAVTGLPAGSTVKYSVNGGEATDAVSVTDAGTYTVVAKVTAPAGYNAIPDLTATITIAKANYTLPALEAGEAYFENTEVTYDGVFHSPTPANPLPEGVGYNVVGEPVRDAGSVGTYTVTFSFSDPAMAANYNPPASIEGLTLTVVKADIDMSGISFADGEKPYNGENQKLAITGDLDPRLSVRYTGGGKKQGTYEVKAVFSFVNAADEVNYNLPAPMTAQLTISAGEFDLTGFNFSNKTYDYSGVDQYPAFNVPEGITFNVTVKKNGAPVTEVILPGTYNVEISFTVASGSAFLAPAPKSYTITVNKAPLNGLTAPTWTPVGTWDYTVGHLSFFRLDQGEVGHNVQLVLPSALLDTEKGTANITYSHKLNGEPVVDTDILDGVGLYETTATITYESDNYALPADYAVTYTFLWVVADKDVDPAAIVFDGASFEYDGESKTIAATHELDYIKAITYYMVVDGVRVPFEGVVSVGEYTVIAVIEPTAESGYAPFEKEAVLTVTPATIDLSDVTFTWDYTEPFDFDGAAHTVKLSAETLAALSAKGVTVAYEGNTATEKGTYTAKAVLTCDSDYVLSKTFDECIFIIKLADEDAWSGEVVQ